MRTPTQSSLWITERDMLFTCSRESNNTMKGFFSCLKKFNYAKVIQLFLYHVRHFFGICRFFDKGFLRDDFSFSQFSRAQYLELFFLVFWLNAQKWNVFCSFFKIRIMYFSPYGVSSSIVYFYSPMEIDVKY